MSSWEILAGDVKPAEHVLLYDDNGAHPGMAAAEALVDRGAELELVTPERFFAPEMGGLNLVPYMQSCKRQCADHADDARDGAQPGRQPDRRHLWSPYSETLRRAGGRPGGGRGGDAAAGDLYFELKEQSLNRGEVDYEALIGGRPQTFPAIRTAPSGFSGSAMPSPRRIVFICHFARTPADIIFRAELELMARNLPSFEFVPVLRGRSPEPTLERLQRPCLRARCYG